LQNNKYLILMVHVQLQNQKASTENL